jgi:acyl-CoA reductase-like NAD-dependent aldehyde dehydrogenase
MSISKADTSVYKNFINGQWVAGRAEQWYQVINPGNTEETVGSFPLSTEEDVEQAVTAAHQAFQSWKKRTASERADYIIRFIDLLDGNKDRLATALCMEQGKPYKEALTEAVRGVKEMRYVVGEALRLEGLTLPSDRPGVTNTAMRVPIGVVAAITPWNFPVLTPLRKIVPALIAGCTVVLKPATPTPLTAVILMELFEGAGLPEGTVNLITGSGRKVGDALVGHPLVKGISFTGSTQVGRHINKLAAERFTKVQLELGGKNPVVVAEYANLERAAAEIVGSAYTNAGQRCTAISRLIVLEQHADALEQLIADKVKQYKVGNGMDSATQIGPVVSEDAIRTIQGYMKSAQEEGAAIILGGSRLTGGIYDKGYYFEPTVITQVTPEMKVAKEEIFGPVLVVIRVRSFEEALVVANNTEYGLTASIFTDKFEWAYDFTEEVDSGMIHINNGTISEGHMPFGGVKNSGLGVYSIGQTNKDFYTDLKVVYTQYKC